MPKTKLSRAEKASNITPKGGKRVRPARREGTAGVAVQSGYILEQETNADLKGVRKFKTYSELLANVEIVGAAVRLLLNMIGKAKWTVVPAEDGGARAEQIAKSVDSIIHDLERPWHRVVRRAAMYRPQGYSWQEWIAKKRDDGVIGFLDIEPRTQSTIERWDVDYDSGNVLGVFQTSPQTYRELYIPRAKSVYVVDDTISDSPEGLGIMRHVAPAAARLQAYERLEGLGFENDLRGIPVGSAPYLALAELVKSAKITQTQADAITSEIEGFVTDHARGKSTGIVLDSSPYKSLGEDASPSATKQWGVDLLSAGNTSQEAISKAIDRLNRAIARLFGTEGMLLGENGSGSLAMSKSKAESVGLIVDGSLVEVAEQFDKDIIGALGRLNGWPKELLPTFKTEKLQHRDILEIADTLESLSRAGAPLDPEDEAIDIVREIAGLPKRDLTATVLDSSLRARRGDLTTDPAGAELDDIDTQDTD